ncbi:hypothetical protein RHSP_31569 [Rhizobium freirei PRF 81]|uniref:Uncharacterized protein n=1 Tax=Rhizobium freirei PRF 81 TaxID=363754 RepID=N6U2H8_9HYPH|nr:hypothetical protein RHSP_31569 [Rhizobium freirei PRF 81]
MIRREAHAVNQNLSLVKGAEVAGLGIAELDDAQQLVIDGVGHRDSVGELLGRIDPVLVADRDVGVRCGSRCLTCEGGQREEDGACEQKRGDR